MKLTKMIDELCPEGVEYKTLGEIGKFYGGLTGKNKSDFTNGNAKFINYKNIFDNIKVDLDNYETVKIGEDEKQTKLEYGDIIFTLSSETPHECGMSSVITEELKEDYYLNSFCFFLRLDDKEILDPEFAKYLFRDYEIRKQIIKTANGVTRFNVSKKQMEKVRIPVPPIEIQERIVTDLDKMQELISGIEEEIKFRKDQLLFSLRKLVSFDKEKVEYKLLDEVVETTTDFTAAGSFATIAENVKYLQQEDYAQLIRTTDLKNNFTNNNFVYVDENAFEFLWRVNLDKECIVLPCVGNCGEVYYIEPEKLPYKNNVLGPNAILLKSETCLNKFLYYYFLSYEFQGELFKITSNTGQTKFNKTNLRKLKIPVPPLEEQKRIAEDLDKINLLIDSLNAELSLRQSQYEYYRSILLKFKEK